jgi:transposase-like protein
MTLSVTHIKALSAPSVKRLLRKRGLTMSDVARAIDRHPSLISRVVRKQAESQLVWVQIAKMVNDQRAP